MDVAIRLKRAREAAGLGTTELAERIGVTKGLVTHIEKGRSDPSWRTLTAWAQACGLEVTLSESAGAALSGDEQELVDDLVAALRAGVLDERRKKFLRMELREYLGDVATSKKAEAG